MRVRCGECQGTGVLDFLNDLDEEETCPYCEGGFFYNNEDEYEDEFNDYEGEW